MNKDLHKTFEEVTFNDDVIQMFKEILKQDYILLELLYKIAAYEHSEKIGITINEICLDLKIERRKKVQDANGPRYIIVKDYIDRKALTYKLEKLLAMTLIYYEEAKPYKHFYTTKRAIQILKSLKE
ncbi:hypothetical protein BGM24_24945 [Bacillus sp. FJAT-26377]|nr:hypothetical protein [Bacillus sp. FJAT-26377]